MDGLIPRALAGALVACGSPRSTEPILIRDGVVLAGGIHGKGGWTRPGRPTPSGRQLGDGRVLVERRWAPGDTVEGQVAPEVAGCVELGSVPLGNVDRLVAAGGEPPDTALAFSPDGERLAIGAWTGEIAVVDGWTGVVVARRTLSEGMVKRLAWAADGAMLYVGEQSPDASVLALDPADLSVRASIRLADDLGTSPAPAPDDPFGAYTLPGVYGLSWTEAGIVAIGAHGWTDADGVRHNRSRAWLLGPDLAVRAVWPADAPADAIFSTLAVGDSRAAIAIRRSAQGPPPSGVPVDGVEVLTLAGLQPVSQVRISPLTPWYSSVFVGDALAIRGDRVAIGTGDGRVITASATTGAIASERDLGTPISAGSIPISATVGWLVDRGDDLYVVTTRSAIPFGAAPPELRPPTLHPAENGLWGMSEPSLEPTWSRQEPHTLQGLVSSGDLLVVGAGVRQGDERTDLFGALVFDLARPPTSRLAAICATSGPVFFRPAVADDGRIALAQFPFASQGRVIGDYRVTVWR